MATSLTQLIQSLCRHGEASWEDTDMDGMLVQEAEFDPLGQRMIVCANACSVDPRLGAKC